MNQLRETEEPPVEADADAEPDFPDELSDDMVLWTTAPGDQNGRHYPEI